MANVKLRRYHWLAKGGKSSYWKAVSVINCHKTQYRNQTYHFNITILALVIYNIGLPFTWALQSLAKLLIITSLSFANPLNSIYTLISSHTSPQSLKKSKLIKAAASMASQINNATFFRSSATTKDSDKVTLLSPNGRCSHLPSKTSGAKKRSAERSKARKRRMVCLKGLASSALYLTKIAWQFQKWHVSDESVNAAECVEPYFSIPVVA